MGLGEKIIAAVTDKIIEKVEKTDPIEIFTGAVNVSSRIVKTIVSSVGEMKTGIIASRERYLSQKKQAEESLKLFAQEIKNASWQSTVEKTSECISFIDEIDFNNAKKVESACICLKQLENIISNKFMEVR